MLKLANHAFKTKRKQENAKQMQEASAIAIN